jgi:hypothetical protein
MQKQADFAAAVTAPKKTALVSGASFAGRATAYRMNKLGYKVTVVEVAKDLKKGGTPVNIGDDKNGLMDKRQNGPCRRCRLLRLSGCRHGRVVGNNWCCRVGDAFQKHRGNFVLAFQDYNERFHPYVGKVQASAANNLDVLIPKPRRS